MTDKTAFTADEWHLLLRTPTYVGTMISYSDPHFFDLMREGEALFQRLAAGTDESLHQPLTLALHDGIVEEAGKSHQLPGHNEANSWHPEATRSILLDKIGQALKLVDGKASAEEATEFRNWLFSVARDVAEVGKEGLLGIRGKHVSGAEQQALDELRNLLGR